MRVRKGIILLGIIGMASFANAYDYSALTKATVKLIESNTEIRTEMEEIKQDLKIKTNKIESTNDKFKDLEQDTIQTKSKFNKLKKDYKSELYVQSEKTLNTNIEVKKNSKSIELLKSKFSNFTTKTELDKMIKSSDLKLKQLDDKLKTYIDKNILSTTKKINVDIDGKISVKDFNSLISKIELLERNIATLKTKNKTLGNKQGIVNKNITRQNEADAKKIKELNEKLIQQQKSHNKYKSFISNELNSIKNSIKMNLNKSNRAEEEIILEKKVMIEPTIRDSEKRSIQDQKRMIDLFNNK